MYKLGKVNRIGPDNGFMFVLDSRFGQNGYAQKSVAYKLYIHDADTVPDMLNINNQVIEFSPHNFSFIFTQTLQFSGN